MTNIALEAPISEATEETIIVEATPIEPVPGEQMDLFPDDLPKTDIIPTMLRQESKWTPADLKKWMENEPPEMDFLFEKVFPAGIAAALCGSGGVGKSTFALQLAYSLATGIEVFPTFVPVKPAKVMIFLGEDPRAITWKRFRNILRAFNPTPAQEALLVKNLFLYDLPAQKLCTVDDGEVVTTPAYDELRRDVSKIRPALLILDPKSRWAGVNENNNDKATAFVTLLEEIIKPHGASLLLTHHVSKAGHGSLGATSVRGASAFVDALRLVFTMVAPEDRGRPPEDFTDYCIKLDIAKSNLTLGFREPINLIPDDNGILAEVPGMKTRTILLNIAQVMRDWMLVNGPINMSAILEPRDDRAFDLHATIETKCGSYKKVLPEAIEVGQQEGLLTLEKVSTKGRPAMTVNARIIPAETAAGAGETVAEPEAKMAA
jgi:hypothetical protein